MSALFLVRKVRGGATANPKRDVCGGLGSSLRAAVVGLFQGVF